MTACWVNGMPQTQASVYDRGLQFGDGLFETLVFRQKQPLLMDAHLERLEQGCLRLKIPINKVQIKQEILSCLAQNELSDGVVKLIITRGCSERGYVTPNNIKPNHYIYINQAPLLNSKHQQGIKLALCETILSKQPLLAGIKHLNRLEQVLARQELPEDCPEGVLCDEDGFVVEGCMSNVFIINNDKLATPIIDRCGVAGIMSEEVIIQANNVGIKVEEKRITLDDLQLAQGIFLTNSLIGIWPVNQFMGRVYDVSLMTKKLQNLIQGSY